MHRWLAALLIALAPGLGWAQGRELSVGPRTITIRLSNFSFEPDHLRLRAGVPIRLRLVNESGGGHDFSAPGNGSAASTGGDRQRSRSAS